MKKNVLLITLILIIIIIICVVGIQVNSKARWNARKENVSFEELLNNEIYGTQVVTLINKATSDNEQNGVAKDEKGFYINNNQNSVQIDLVMITNEETNETTTYKMEAISKVGITEFIKNFNTAKFKCTKKEYHQETGKIAYIELSQQEET